VVGVSEHYFSENPSSSERRGLIRTSLNGFQFEFVTSSGVFSHKRIDNGTRLLVESMVLPTEGKVLDIGCGYGVIGIAIAKRNPGLRVWMTDVNSRAVSLAEENTHRNSVRVTILQGSLFEPVQGETFDVIITNPPISAGIAKIVEPLIRDAFPHLNSGGSLQLVVQSNKGGRTVSALIEETFGNIEVVARGGGYKVFRAFKKNELKGGCGLVLLRKSFSSCSAKSSPFSSSSGDALSGEKMLITFKKASRSLQRKRQRLRRQRARLTFVD